MLGVDCWFFRCWPGLGDVHQLRFEPVDEGTEGKAALPGGRQVCDGHIPVALCLFLAPGEKSRRPDLRLH